MGEDPVEEDHARRDLTDEPFWASNDDFAEVMSRLSRRAAIVAINPMPKLDDLLDSSLSCRGPRTRQEAGLRDRVEFREGDVLRLPFPDASFGVVLCVTVLSHVPNGEAAIPELVRVLRSGGRLGVFDLDTDMTAFTHPDRALTRRIVWDRSSIVDGQAAEAVARERGSKLLSFEIRDASAIDTTFSAASRARASAVLVSASGILFPHARRIAQLCSQHRLPAMYGLREYVEAGGLISYGPEINDIWRRAAVSVDKILKGARLAELPVEQPVKFELIINLPTAKALGLTIPQPLLARADQVIE
jgi:hypothetical protein